jgi:hypothetical protein
MTENRLKASTLTKRLTPVGASRLIMTTGVKGNLLGPMAGSRDGL